MSFQYGELSEAELRNKQDWDVKSVGEIGIERVVFKSLKKHVDDRGDLTELWSQPWSVQGKVASEVKHVYWNTTHQGVIKGWHVHQQTNSQYTCIVGKMQVVLVDVRTDSPTYGQVNQLLLGSHNPGLVRIPSGVLKGWKSLQGDGIIVNLLTSADVEDNHKYPWDCILKDIWMPRNG